ncbi:MAG: outer membrane protein transport protein [Deltaproteobacteria bacterium]|nr:outer membrane protein transport protein [Deltaproteobacteria bacterium]
MSLYIFSRLFRHPGQSFQPIFGIVHYCLWRRKSANFLLSALVSAAVLTAALPLPPVRAAGFALMQQGTAAMGQGNAFVAEASDPSAIFYNPAGISQLTRPELYIGTTYNYPDREFHGPGGFSQTNHRIYRSPSIYLVYPFNDHVAAGFGFFVPFGLGSAWHPEWAGRYITTFSDLKTYNFNPVLSIKILENLSVAMGPNFLWTSAELKRKIPIFAGPVQLPDGESKLEGDASGAGFNFGVLYEPAAGFKVGVSYRSHIAVNYEGDLELVLPRPFPAQPKIPGTVKLTFPPSVTAGISLSRFQPLTVNFDVTWTGWSSYDRLDIKLSRPILVNGVLTSTISQPKNWNDAWAFRFGANYQVNENMKIRAGYIYDLTPVPDETFEPQVPDADRHIFTVGSDLKVWRLTLGIAYNYILTESRDKNNRLTFNGVPLPPQFQANGRYESSTHSLGLSASYKF